MPFSDNYIKMCSLAAEIQAMKVPLWGFCKFELGDYFTKGEEIFYLFHGNNEQQPKTENVVWLPRQDQLQQILIDYERATSPMPDITVIVNTLSCDIVNYFANSEKHWYTSFEEMWLYLVMQRVHDKLWKLNDWR